MRSQGKVIGTQAARFAVGTAAAMAMGAAAPNVGAAGPVMYTHNICGALGCQWQGSTSVLDPLKFSVAAVPPAETPMAIGLQESCGNQFNDFKNFLRTRDSWYWGIHYSQVATTECGSGTQNYGVSAYSLASYNPFSNGAWYGSGPYSQQAPQGDGEARGWACVSGGASAPLYWSCSSHLTPADQTTARQQFNSYFTGVVAPRLFTGTQVLWGGDFYITQPNLPVASPSFSYTNNREADLCLPGTNGYRWTFRNKANGALSKYDYAFRSSMTSNCATDAVLAPASASDMWDGVPPHPFPSDHRILGGYQP